MPFSASPYWASHFPRRGIVIISASKVLWNNAHGHGNMYEQLF